MLKKLSDTTYTQIIFVGLIILIGTIALGLLGYGIAYLIYGSDSLMDVLHGVSTTTAEISILKLLQFMSQLSMFVFPPLALAWMIRKDKPDFLCLSTVPDIAQALAIIILFVASLPIIQYTMSLNQQMQLPESMHSLQEWMLTKENLAAEITKKFLNTSSTSSYLINLLVMAIMPAVGEELIFRGLLTRWVAKITKNIHLNIIITSIIFSAFHLQFFGFLPRFLLGMLLGYSYYFTQSLWSSILLHFTNNAMTVSVYFWVFKSGKSINPEDVGTVDSYGYVLMSLLVVGGVLYWLATQKTKKHCLS